MKRKLTVLTVLFLILGLGLVGSASAGKLQSQLSQESTLEQIMKRGVMRVGMDTFVPWAMKDKTGKFVGFEIDVATQLAEDMGVKVEFVPTKWAGIIPALLTGKFDVLIGGMGITTKRALKVNFTIPYDYSGMSMVASKKKAAGFDSLEDFNKPDVELAIKMGTTAVMAAKKFMPKAKLRLFEDQAQAYQEPIAFALPKGDFDTLVFFNGWIQTKRDEGWLQEKHQYWFGTRDWASLVE